MASPTVFDLRGLNNVAKWFGDLAIKASINSLSGKGTEKALLPGKKVTDVAVKENVKIEVGPVVVKEKVKIEVGPLEVPGPVEVHGNLQVSLNLPLLPLAGVIAAGVFVGVVAAKVLGFFTGGGQGGNNGNNGDNNGNNGDNNGGN